VLADCSMSALLPQETRGRRELPDELTAPAASGCRQNEDDDERRHLMSAAGSLPDTLVLCHAHSDMPEHTTRTGCAPGRVTGVVPEAME